MIEEDEIIIQTEYRLREIPIVMLITFAFGSFRNGEFPDPKIIAIVVTVYAIIAVFFMNKLILYKEMLHLKYPLAPFKDRRIPLEEIERTSQNKVLLAKGNMNYHIHLKSGKKVTFSTLPMRHFGILNFLLNKHMNERSGD